MPRWASPVILFTRYAVAVNEISGTAIGEGDLVALFYPAANRDPAVFEDPDVFDATQSPNPMWPSAAVVALTSVCGGPGST
jgi:cholest-4-en-3-one 26-monooxygenase